ncbi:PREDICTED: fibrous sheath CABYR-binding protein-like, partial [Fulmarus glacialis]|uniref:fibrous sheath CABYR-binding protein-like n=1 Tax=Fulmarus glacialis TaxID=30455 RepID=UPI00051C7ACC
LQYPAQLVSEALEDALKEMKDDAQPKEEPTLSAAWDPRDACTPSPVLPTETHRGAGEGQDPSEGAGDGEAPEAEERAGEAVLQGLGAESSALRDEATSPPALQPCGMAACPSLSAMASREEMGAWEEEMPIVLSSREPEVVAQEASRPSEEEEEGGPHSPCGEDGDFQGEGMDAREGESLQREVEATRAVPMESHPVLPTESHLEEDLVDGEQEKSEHWEMPMCKMDLAAEEEREQETCPGQDTCLEQEPSSIHEAIPAEEPSSGAEEDAVEREDPGRAKGGEGEKGEAGREALGGEDPRAGEAVGLEAPGQESRAQEEPGDLQENGFAGEDWEVTAEDTEWALGTERPAWADDTPTSTGGLGSEERDSMSPAELEETREYDEDVESQGMSQQQPPPEAEPAPGLVRDEQEGTAGQPAQAPADAPGQGDSQEPAEAPEEPWEMQDEDANDELGSDPGQPESSSTGPAALQQAPGDGAEGSESAEEDAGRSGKLEQAPGTGRRVELEDTLPGSTPLHLYEGEMLTVVAPSQNSPEIEETMETDPAFEKAPEDEGWLEGKDKPPTPTMPESREEEAGTEVAPAAEGAEEEEGYFMVSAPNQEVSSSEEAEISEDFEEIKVEATEAIKDDLEAPGEASPVPEDEGHFEAFVGEADEDMKMPTEELEMRKDEDENEDDAEGFTAELEEGPAVPEADPAFPGAKGPLAGGADEPAQDAEVSGAHEGPGRSEGLAAKLVEELDSMVEPESDAGRAETLPGCNLGLVGQEEEEDDDDEPSTAHHDTAEPIPPAGLQAQVMPVSSLPDQVEQTSDEQPSAEEEALDSDSPPLAGDEEPPEADPPRPGSVPEQGGFPEMIKESAEAADLSAKVPADVMKDSDILEIVEQALEFNQELMMGTRAAEGGQRDPGGTELPRDTEEDSSPEPTVQEAPADAAPGIEGPVRAENGLHREASLEDLAEFIEEVPNGIAGMLPAQEFPTETADPTA